MGQELINKYRPSDFDEVIGHAEILKSLQRALGTDSRPHAFLFSGAAGIGKTTIARIVGKFLGADILEIDAAANNGVDDMRALKEISQYTSLFGNGVRMYIIDECFAKGTRVNTPNGLVPIEYVKPGDYVIGATGVQRVKRTLQKKVPVSRIMRVQIDNKYLFVSEDHAFLTPDGWVHAKDLMNVGEVCSTRTTIQPQLLKMQDKVYEYGLSGTETGDRNRRSRAFTENRSVSRQQEDGISTENWLGSVKSVERGSKYLASAGIDTHTDANGQFAIFHDLEVEGHPSYSAEGSIVHNCHMLSKSAWNSILKMLEEPPPHLYIALCTTEINKVIETARIRCFHAALRPLSYQEIEDLVVMVSELEGWKVVSDVIQIVVQAATGQPRKALSILQAVHDAPNRDEVKRIITLMDDSDPAIELIRSIVSGKEIPWSKVHDALKKMETDDFDQTNEAITGYLAAVFFGAEKEEQATIAGGLLEIFTAPVATYNKKAAFAVAMYRIGLKK